MNIMVSVYVRQPWFVKLRVAVILRFIVVLVWLRILSVKQAEAFATAFLWRNTMPYIHVEP